MKVPNAYRVPLMGAAAALAIVIALAGAAVWTAPVRKSVRAYTELLSAANGQDVAAAKRLCTGRYVETHPLVAAPDGGIVGLPRNIHKNFQAWREGPHVWLCPTNRVGPVYQFVLESGDWRFDGPIGILRGHGEVVKLEESGLSETIESTPGR